MNFVTNWLQKVLENLLPPEQAARTIRYTLKVIKSGHLYPLVFGLTSVMTIALVMRYTSTYYGLVSRYQAILPSDEWQLVAQNDVWNSLTITLGIYALCTGGGLGAIVGLITKKLAQSFSVAILIGCGLGVILNFSFPTVQYHGMKIAQSNVYLEALELLEQGEASVALTRLNRLYPDFVGTSQEDDLRGRMGQAHYMNRDFRASILTYASLLYEKPDSPIRANIEQSLHWSIYGLSQKEGLKATTEYVMQIRRAYLSDHISVAWTVVPPKIEGYLWLNPLGVPDYYWEACLSDDEYFMIKGQMRSLVAEYPDDPYIDVVAFLLGDFTEIMQDAHSPIRDLAFYAQANHLRHEGDLDGAVAVYLAYLDLFSYTSLSDDVAYDLAVTYRMMGDYPKSWAALCLASTLPDHDMQQSIELEAVRLIDIFMPLEEVEALRSTTATDCVLVDVLEYSYGEKLMAERRFVDARAQFERVKSLYPTSNLAPWCDHNIDLLDRFVVVIQRGQNDYKIQLAELIVDNFKSYSYGSDLCNTSFLTFYNELWFNNRRSALYVEERNPNIPTEVIEDYYKHQNDFLVAVQLIEEFMLENPSHLRVVDAMWLRARLYRQLSVDSAFLPSGIDSMSQASMREKAHLAYQDIIDLSPSVDQAVQAIAERAQIYLLYPYDYQRAIAEFRYLVDAYPDHRLANNALMWISRLNWRLARQASFRGDTLLANAFIIQSQQAYEQVLGNPRYHAGHVGEEAQEELILLGKWWVEQTQ